MKSVRITNTTRNAELADRALLADTHWTRLRGLIGRPSIRPGEGLVIAPSRGVHTYGMRYAIDVVLVDEAGKVVALHPDLQPAAAALEHPRHVGRVEVQLARELVVLLVEGAAGDEQANRHALRPPARS